jgi:hypothetical protein
MKPVIGVLASLTALLSLGCGKSDSENFADSFCASGTKQCMAKGANGAACTTTNMCQSSNCPSGTCESNGLDTFGLQLLCG